MRMSDSPPSESRLSALGESQESSSPSSSSILSRRIYNLEVRLRNLRNSFTQTQDTVSFLEGKIENLQQQDNPWKLTRPLCNLPLPVTQKG